VTSEIPSPPDPDQWLRWNVEVLAELHAGKQSRVFEALLNGERSAIKLTESRLADIALLTSRMEAVEALAASHPGVLTPTRVDGTLVQPIGEWLMTATPFIPGERLDENIPGDAERLGAALARLHGAMRQLEKIEIPTIAALDATAADQDRTGWQLLHGDFSTQNVIATPETLWIFDFDDCGYGPVEYDIPNSIYMVLFDADVTRRPERYEAFRPAFLSGYEVGSLCRVADAAVDEMIALRIDALGRWLDDLSTAPIGIRTSSLEWLETLAAFVKSHRPVGGR
jgi:Ser/Thr protein kinase RdoA (MazF antagonist)